MKKIIVNDAIFIDFPDFKRGIIIVKHINNLASNNKIQQLLNKEIEARKGDDSFNHEFVKAWDVAHQKFGSNANKYLPSIKSLLKRIQKGDGFPFINSVVALFNYISIKYLIPCGGDDVAKIKGNLQLGFATGDENFVPLGSSDQDNPIPSEVIYFDDLTFNVMCRRWNWRNGDFSKITEHTRHIVINIDGIGPVSQSIVEEARDEMAKLLIEHCSAQLITGMLDKDNREMVVET
ncbi:MAG: B3/4 domain-containing protein [Tenuifilaceae bacterium]